MAVVRERGGSGESSVFYGDFNVPRHTMKRSNNKRIFRAVKELSNIIEDLELVEYRIHSGWHTKVILPIPFKGKLFFSSR